MIFALVCALALGGAALAGASTGEPVGETTAQRIDKTHQQLSHTVTHSAQWLDNFFDDELSSAEDNHTRLRLKFSIFKQSSEDVGISTDFDLRLALPKMENRLLLMVSGNPDTDENLDDSPLDEAKRRFEERDKTNLNLALRFFPKMEALSNASLDGGLSFRKLVPAPYLGARYRHLWELAPWQARVTQTARWYSDRGVEAKTRLDMERDVGRLFFRASTEWGYYQDNADGWLPDLRFLLYQPLDKKKVLEYEWNNNFKTRPEVKLKSIVLRTRLRQQVWREWLFVEVAPQVAFRDKDDWEFDPGILLRLEINFGFAEK